MPLAIPFSKYVAEAELPSTDDARRFEFRLLIEPEGTGRVEHLRWLWSYSGTKAAMDDLAGRAGLAHRRRRERDRFRRHVEKELAKTGQRLYPRADHSVLIRGTAKIEKQ